MKRDASALPGLYADVSRPEAITVEAFDLDGQPFRVKVDDLPARVIQHENDHLDGVLFIDRIDETELAQFASKLGDFNRNFRQDQATGTRLSDDDLTAQLRKMAESGDFSPIFTP